MTSHYDRIVVLASASPRRKELLKQVGLGFTVEPADVDERVTAGESPGAYALRVAANKAQTAAARVRGGLVIAADTIVVLDGEILGKPADARDAERMLALLSGRQHQVMTALVIVDAKTGKRESRLVVTSVWFRMLSTKEIFAYAATGEPLDKAGGYGIQGKGALLVEKIEGCYFNVVGLPLSVLKEMLQSFGLEPL